MTVRILNGDVRAMLRTLPAESVHCCVTSPPYWGLRDYGIEASVWGGDENCAHQWGAAISVASCGGLQGDNGQRADRSGHQEREAHRLRGQFCDCGAWRGALGLEPDYRLYVEHMVDVFRDIHRVLRPDGVVWLNLGDTYIGAVHGNNGYGTTSLTNQGEYQARKTLPRVGKSSNKGQLASDFVSPSRCAGGPLKNKDLVGIPWRVALALQDDGWWLRQDIVWSKPNPMPESVTDRCTKAHEYVFQLSKAERYYFDQEAILEESSANTHARLAQDVAAQLGSERAHEGARRNGRPMKAVGRTPVPVNWNTSVGEGGHGSMKRGGARTGSGPKTQPPQSGIRNNNDFIEATSAAVVTRRNKRSVWTIATEAFSGEFCTHCKRYYEGDLLRALHVQELEIDGKRIRRRYCGGCGRHDSWLSHFATFPSALVLPCIQASTSDHGCCVRCGAPWERVVRVSYSNPGNRKTNGPRSDERKHLEFGTAGYAQRLERETATLGWYPRCACVGAPKMPAYGEKPDEAIDRTRAKLCREIAHHLVVPATVLEPFLGSGTTALVADRLKRHCIGIELNPDYAAMARQRVCGETPLLTEVAVA